MYPLRVSVEVADISITGLKCYLLDRELMVACEPGGPAHFCRSEVALQRDSDFPLEESSQMGL